MFGVLLILRRRQIGQKYWQRKDKLWQHTYSTSLKLALIGDGDQSGIWGQTTNTNLGTLLEQAITGVQSITMVDANYTLTNFNGTLDEARNAVLIVTGTNSAVPAILFLR